jgi:hypothetical protein
VPRGRCTFRQRDVTAAIKAAKAAGEEVVRVEVGRDGNIIIVTSKSEARLGLVRDYTNDWDVSR